MNDVDVESFADTDSSNFGTGAVWNFEAGAGTGTLGGVDFEEAFDFSPKSMSASFGSTDLVNKMISCTNLFGLIWVSCKSVKQEGQFCWTSRWFRRQMEQKLCEQPVVDITGEV